MRLEIRELLSEWEENEIDLSSEADIEHIRAKTLCKIGIGTKRRRPLRIVLIAAAAVLLLAGVTAAAYFGIVIKDTEPAVVKAGDDSEIAGDEDLYFLGENHTLNFDVTGNGTVVGFRADSIPGKNGELFMGYLDKDFFDCNGVDISELPDLENVCYLLESTVTVDGKSYLAAAIHTYYGRELHDKFFTLNGEITVVKHENIGDLEAVFLTQDRSKTVTAVKDGEEIYGYSYEPVWNVLLLFDKAHESLIHVCADSTVTDMEELEKFAAGLEIVDTGIPASCLPQSAQSTIELEPMVG